MWRSHIKILWPVNCLCGATTGNWENHLSPGNIAPPVLDPMVGESCIEDTDECGVAVVPEALGFSSCAM